MNIVGLLVVLIVIGVILWLINQYVPMQPPFKTIINILVVLVVIIWLLSAVGVLPAHISVR